MAKKTNGMMSLNDAFMAKLKALYDIESELVKALPKMAKKATNEDLREAFEEHLKETETHVERLEQAFSTMDMKPSKIRAEGVRGIVADAEWAIKEKPSDEVLDAMLIASATYVEHYEIAGYTAAIKWARLLGNDEVADSLEETLKEEEMADDKLNSLADEGIDEAAMSSGGDMEGEDDDDEEPKKKGSEEEEESADDESEDDDSGE